MGSTKAKSYEADMVLPDHIRPILQALPQQAARRSVAGREGSPLELIGRTSRKADHIPECSPASSRLRCSLQVTLPKEVALRRGPRHYRASERIWLVSRVNQDYVTAHPPNCQMPTAGCPVNRLHLCWTRHLIAALSPTLAPGKHHGSCTCAVHGQVPTVNHSRRS